MSRTEPGAGRRLLASPVLHFAILGLAFFALYLFFGRATSMTEDRIVVTQRQIELMSAAWEKQWRRPPDEREVRGLIDGFIREEVYYREALAMGLDRDDPVVRRRMAQKIEFMAKDLSTLGEPSEAELQAFYEEHADTFREPARMTVTQVYVNLDRRGPGAETEAMRLLSQLRAGAIPDEIGDPLMLPSRFVNRSQVELEREFGARFADEVADLPPDSWQGPVVSGFGLHLVLVEGRQEAYLPPLDEVRSDVRNEWDSFRRREADAEVFSRLRERYRIEIEGATEPAP